MGDKILFLRAPSLLRVPMVPCEWSLVAVTHTHTPLRTARPPAAPPRRERDEEMDSEGGAQHVWEVSLCVTLVAARRFSLSGTAPPSLLRQESIAV